MRWPFQAWGASAVVSGHSHSYERIMIAGFPYFVNGAGGSGTTSFALIAVSGTEVRFNDDMGAMRVIADQAAITFEFITRSGELIDFFKLTAVE